MSGRTPSCTGSSQPFTFDPVHSYRTRGYAWLGGGHAECGVSVRVRCRVGPRAHARAVDPYGARGGVSESVAPQRFWSHPRTRGNDIVGITRVIFPNRHIGRLGTRCGATVLLAVDTNPRDRYGSPWNANRPGNQPRRQRTARRGIRAGTRGRDGPDPGTGAIVRNPGELTTAPGRVTVTGRERPRITTRTPVRRDDSMGDGVPVLPIQRRTTTEPRIGSTAVVRWNREREPDSV